jgi:D-beta-D-heptose 7-phosphate kinase/D-beta-D-heptose 1-phosphate adenosyltransferase
VKGGDYSIETLPEARVILGYGGKVEIMPFFQDRSTTSLIRKIRDLDRLPA